MIIADTGFFVALGNKNDNFHAKAKQKLVTLKEPLITTYPVVVETSYLLWERCGNDAQFKFIRQLTQGSIKIFHLENIHLERMLELMIKYLNLPMDLADASLVVLAETIQENRILTTDRRDFTVYRWLNNQTFELLL
ncbi:MULTISPECIES: type II toxin-antitoxin system VapC family toxin [Microcystis]|jgi:predicted nucleic acid-binding protein|uniref:PIN domain protein n=5 Tax=Microcystis TaxID=1125 RepID=L7E7U4_MICAE|nr:MULTISPECIES: PIN domain-containing protein [Microcystis]REJ51653.1 MAG: PIN domain-containing protein [Microcystis aeruginosa DA14]ELP54723.1 PIN domain protein [Microcystis aeruginosa TAIHU98]MBD2599189.1 PIN domain-containing protein [Microcystis viridis FACHB-1342]MBE9245708.1 PIN domain-containing protein [Microcystis aeruginosa LEGE 00239]MCA2625392.1 PIN domain-containing protein [Microcystis sp. M19BS1]